MDKYFWAFNDADENWYHSENTIEACVEEARAYGEDEYDSIYIGECVEYIPSIDAEIILSSVVDDAYNECGDGADDYLVSVEDEHEIILGNRLTQVFLEWQEEFGYKQSMGKLINITEYKL